MSNDTTPSFDDMGLPGHVINCNNFVRLFPKYGPSDTDTMRKVIRQFTYIPLPDDSPLIIPGELGRTMCINQLVEYFKEEKYMKNEIDGACDVTNKYYLGIRRGYKTEKVAISRFYTDWRNKLLSKIQLCITYEIWVDVCIGDIIDSPTTLCKVKFVRSTHKEIQLEFSQVLDQCWIPSCIKVNKDRQSYIDHHGGYLNGSLVSPCASDELWNDSHLGLSLTSVGPDGERTFYPPGTMYILLPDTPTLQRVQLEREQAWMYESMVKSEIALSDEVIQKMMDFMSKVKI